MSESTTQKRRRLGLCIGCGGESREGKTLCQPCQVERLSSHERRRPDRDEIYRETVVTFRINYTHDSQWPVVRCSSGMVANMDQYYYRAKSQEV